MCVHLSPCRSRGRFGRFAMRRVSHAVSALVRSAGFHRDARQDRERAAFGHLRSGRSWRIIRAMTEHSKNHDWLAQTIEVPLEPGLPICDPHHHLWDRRAGRVAPRYLLDEILEDVGAGHNVVSTVFIECGAMLKTDGPDALRPIGETEFVNGIAAMSASGLYGN